MQVESSPSTKDKAVKMLRAHGAFWRQNTRDSSRTLSMSGAVAEVILTWHIATSLLETKQQQQLPTSPSRSRRTAARLSRYCAYLVAFRPELLPDDREGTERIYKDLKKGIKAALGGARGYYLSSERSRHETIRALPAKLASADADMTVLERGAVLGKQLVNDEAGDGAVWEMLADVWVELVVYVSPSRAEEHAKGHEATLVQGSELVTLLWVLSTHTGIARPDHEGEVDQPAPALA
uniref:Uncharacterized protein n=1 Tax=Oryza barthii TaxID=65489 RepID=A0A0D3GC54_9ORYZ